MYTGSPSLNVLHAFRTLMKDLRYIVAGGLRKKQGEPEVSGHLQRAREMTVTTKEKRKELEGANSE